MNRLVSLAIASMFVLSSCTLYEDIEQYLPKESIIDSANVSAEDLQEVALERVVDGDTIVVVIDGESYRVRLLGIDTPESVAPSNYLEKSGKENTEEGAAASEYTKNLLSDTEVVYLQEDISDTDEYGRLLRYVWLERPTDCMDMQEIENKMLNAILLKDGVADVVTYPPDDMYEDIFNSIRDEVKK